jgi:hypothetical protein
MASIVPDLVYQLFPLVKDIQTEDQLAVNIDMIIKLVMDNAHPTCRGVCQQLADDEVSLKRCTSKTTDKSGMCKIHRNSILGDYTALSEKGLVILNQLIEKRRESSIRPMVDDTKAVATRKRGNIEEVLLADDSTLPTKKTPEIFPDPEPVKKRMNPKVMKDLTTLFGGFGVEEKEKE